MITKNQTQDIKFAKISAASSGNNTIVAAVSGKRIIVLTGLLMAAATVNATFQSDASGTALTGAMPLIANVGFGIPYCPVGNFQTDYGVLLNLSLSGAQQVSGWIVYVLDGGNDQ